MLDAMVHCTCVAPGKVRAKMEEARQPQNLLIRGRIFRVPLFHDSSFHGLISPVVAPEPETTVYFSLESRGSMSHRDAARLTSRTWKRRFPPVRSSARAEGTASQTMEALNAMEPRTPRMRS